MQSVDSDQLELESGTNWRNNIKMAINNEKPKSVLSTIRQKSKSLSIINANIIVDEESLD